MILKVQPKTYEEIFLRFLFCLINCIAIGLPAIAQKRPVIQSEVRSEKKTERPVKKDDKEKDWEQSFIQSNREISAWFDGVTEGIDLFLVGKRVTKEKNKSSFRIDNTTTITETENFNNTSSIAIRPRFKNLEEFLQLKFTSYDEKEDGRGVENGYLRKTQRRKNYGATLGFFRKLGNVRTTFQPRIELQDPLKISHSLSFESVAEIKKFQMNPKIEFFADADKGTGVFQALNFNYEFGPIWDLTLINEGEYQEKIHKLLVTNGFAFGQQYNEKTGFTYSWILNSDNRERYHLGKHVVSVTWHQNIYKNILDIQLQPFLEFDKANRFKGKSGVIFNISINF